MLLLDLPPYIGPTVIRVFHNNSPCFEQDGGNRSIAQDSSPQTPPGPYNPGCYAAGSDYNPSASDLQHILAHQRSKTIGPALGNIGDIRPLVWWKSCCSEDINKTNGRKIAEYKLDASPIFDGLIAANGNLYISTKLGTVVCMAEGC